MVAGTADLQEWAAQQKREANLRHRARKRAAKAQERAAAAQLAGQIGAEEQRQVALRCEQAALHSMAAYQQEAVALLNMSALASALEQPASSDSELPGHAGSPPLDAPPRQRQLSAATCWSSESAAESEQQQQQQQPSPQGCEVAPPTAGPAPAPCASSAPTPANSDDDAPRSGPSSTAGASAPSAPGCSAGSAATVQQLHVWAGGDASSVAGADSEPTAANWASMLSQWGQESWLARTWRQDISVVHTPWVKRLIWAALEKASVHVMVQRNRYFVQQLQRCVDEWEACPRARPDIERALATRFMDRLDVMAQCARARPTALLETYGKLSPPPPPTGADGKPPLHASLLPVAHFLEAALPAEQLAQLRQAWLQCKQAVAAAGQQCAAATAQLQYAAALHSLSWRKQGVEAEGGSSAERARAFDGMAGSMASLGGLGREQMLAIIELQATVVRLLPPIDMARLYLAAWPYGLEMVQVGDWLFTPAAAPVLPGPSGLAPAGAGGAPLDLLDLGPLEGGSPPPPEQPAADLAALLDVWRSEDLGDPAAQPLGCPLGGGGGACPMSLSPCDVGHLLAASHPSR